MGIPVGIAPVALQQFLDVSGNPLAGGLLYTYASGTTTPVATFADADGITPNPNPVVLDSGGFASPGLFLQALAYTFTLTDSNNIPQWSQDGVVSEQAVANLKTPTQQHFDTSGTFFVPTNVSGVKVTVVGGGGAGGGSTASQNGGGGGAGGAAISWLTTVPGDSITVAVGAGGVGVSAANGGPGGPSIVVYNAITITAAGGAGGTAGAGVQAGGGGGGATGGDLNFAGNAGGFSTLAPTTTAGGPGGGSIFGGGAPAAFAIPGVTAMTAGAGGGGAGANANAAGGNGGGGLVIFEYLQ